MYQNLKWAAVILGISWLLWTLYEGILKPNLDPATAAYSRATRDFKDDKYDAALKSYERALENNPQHRGALRGKGDSLLLLGDYSAAIAIYDELILMLPELGVHYANRGIAYDRLGEYEKAISDYETAYSLNANLDRGPNWLTRFLRNQEKKPATIMDRAAYLKEQLQLPVSERLLRLPAEDDKQRPYTK